MSKPYDPYPFTDYLKHFGTVTIVAIIIRFILGLPSSVGSVVGITIQAFSYEVLKSKGVSKDECLLDSAGLGDIGWALTLIVVGPLK